MAEAIFLDADGDELYRTVFSDSRTLDRAMKVALTRYQPRKIRWSRTIPKSGTVLNRNGTGNAVLVAFVDGRPDSLKMLKALEDPRVAKLHGRFHFVRRSYRRGAREMRDWSVFRAPTLVVLGPGKTGVVSRQAGVQKPWELKKFLDEALAKVEEGRKPEE